MTGEKAGDPMFDLAAFSAAVRDCSAALGMSVREAARDSGISPATFNRIQRGKAPDVENYLRIMAWLKLNQWPAPMTAPAAMPDHIPDTGKMVPAAMPSEERFPVLRDKLELWRQQSVEGNMGLRDYHRRAVLELEALLAAEAALAAERERCIAIVDAQVPDWVKERSGPYWEGYRDAMEDAAEDMRNGSPPRAAAIRAQGE